MSAVPTRSARAQQQAVARQARRDAVASADAQGEQLVAVVPDLARVLSIVAGRAHQLAGGSGPSHR